MDEIATDTAVKTPTAPAKKRRAPVKRKKAASRAARAEASVPKNDLAGMTARACPAACTAERCVISTVAICKHPKLTADSGCGPVTLANRDRARKYLKHQEIDRS